MAKTVNPWIGSRGMERLLARETNISDLIQLLSDRDRGPWTELVGFEPGDVAREARIANNADLLLTSSDRSAAIEVKLGHLMSDSQQSKYEELTAVSELYLAAMSSDMVRLEVNSDRWRFVSLSDLISRWNNSSDISRECSRSKPLTCCDGGTK